MSVALVETALTDGNGFALTDASGFALTIMAPAPPAIQIPGAPISPYDEYGIRTFHGKGWNEQW